MAAGTSVVDEHLALAERAAAHALEVLGEVDYVQLTLPTPCGEWDVRRLLLHVAAASDLLAGLVSPGLRPIGAPSASEDLSAFASAGVGRLLGALTAAAEGVPTDHGVARFREAASGAAIELSAHAWDLAVVGSSRARIPDALAADVYDLATQLVTEDARGIHFGPPVGVPPGASASERLVGFLGRDPAWTPGSP